MMYKISKENLPALLKKISLTQDLFVPSKISGKTNYALYDENTEVDLETLKTVKSGKDLFFPQSETLYTCLKDGKKISIEPEKLREEKFVVFGMKACDVAGVEILDRVFLSDPVDTFYKARRDNGTIVSLICNEPDTSCFCKAFGIDNTAPKGDVVLAKAGDDYYWETKSEKGDALTEEVKELLSSCDDDSALKAEKEKIQKINGMLPNMNISLKNWGKDENLEIFSSENWEKLSSACLACGTCTFVCPTCQCYDIKDYDTGHGVQRYRCWDSCMYSDFTMMAHGNNRTTQMQRYRQRFMHKLVYFPTNNDGVFSCVGCGRCVDLCPSGLNILKVIKKWEEK